MEWVDGTVLHYWFNNPYFGLNEKMKWINQVLFLNYTTTSISAWSVIILELFLFMGLIAKDKYKKPLLYAGFIFHLLTWFIHGLFSFFLIMTSALIIYLAPINRPIKDLIPSFTKIKKVGVVKSNNKACLE